MYELIKPQNHLKKSQDSVQMNRRSREVAHTQAQ